MFLALALYTMYLMFGWIALTRGIRYLLLELRQEVELSGIDCPPGDRFFTGLLVLIYLLLLNVWPVAVYRKIRHGRVVGKP